MARTTKKKPEKVSQVRTFRQFFFATGEMFLVEFLLLEERKKLKETTKTKNVVWENCTSLDVHTKG
jgi:hypothetical protein